MANNVKIAVGAPGAKQASSEIDQLRDKFSKIQQQGAKGFAIGAGAAVTAGAIGGLGSALNEVASIAEGAIQKASDLNETINKSEVVFGSSADQVKAWGQTAATSMGLSENAAIGAAASIGNLLLSTGTAKEKIAPMSEGIVQLASDLASFNNIPIDDALAKLQSGLVGQERPLRELGVAISAASVDAEALNLGFKKVNGTFTEGEKVQARYALIFQQTTTAQGDFARTSNQLANSQRIASAELEDLQAKLGQELLPIVLAATHAAEGLVIAVEDVGSAADGLASGLDKVVGVTKKQADQSDFLGDNTTVLGRALHGLAEDIGWLFGQEKDLLGITPNVSAGFSDMGLHAGKMADDIALATTTTKANASSMDSHLGKVKDDVDRYWLRLKHSAEEVATANELSAGRIIAARKAERDASISDAETEISDYFNVIQTQDNLTATNAEIAAQRRILASSTATAAQKHDAQVALHTLYQQQTNYLITLATAGKIGGKEYTAAMTDLEKRLKTAHGAEAAEIRTEIALLKMLASQAQTSAAAMDSLYATNNQKKGTHHFAAGGHYTAGEARIVGENGPEIDIPDHSGTIVPNNAIGRTTDSTSSVGTSAIAGLTINGGVHFHDVGSDVTPAAGNRMARAFMMEVASGFRQEGARNGLHPRRP